MMTTLSLAVPSESEVQGVDEILERSMKEEHLTIENWVRSEVTGKREQTVLSRRFASLPPILCLHLLLFDFDTDTMTRKKKGGRVVCPLSFSIPSSCCSDSSRHRTGSGEEEREEEREEAEGEGEGSSSDSEVGKEEVAFDVKGVMETAGFVLNPEVEKMFRRTERRRKERKERERREEEEEEERERERERERDNAGIRLSTSGVSEEKGGASGEHGEVHSKESMRRGGVEGGGSKRGRSGQKEEEEEEDDVDKERFAFRQSARAEQIHQLYGGEQGGVEGLVKLEKGVEQRFEDFYDRHEPCFWPVLPLSEK
mmetsp:Transcript_5669/g.13229  ORF Transcript_5669/g.13229 Transcript_5669/m.13229 type:complete len:313 (-) Transcript_5669:245-1183(-)